MTPCCCDKPAVSILMAVYNAGPYLSLAIDSLLKQTFTDFELIIVDDGSTDGSQVTISKFKSADNRIQAIRNEQNLGLVASLNRGLAACRADLVARADADDVFFPDRIRRQFEYLETHPEVGVLGAAVKFIDQHGAEIDRKLHQFPTSSSDIRLHSLLGCCIWHTTVMFRKILVEEAGQYSPEYVGGPEDYDLWARLQDTTAFANLPEPLAQQRLHSQSVTAGWEVGFSMFCSIAQRLQGRYLGRDVTNSEATAIVSLCMDGDLEHVDCAKAFQILREILIKAAAIEDNEVFMKFRSRCAHSLLRQAGFNVYKQRKLSWRLMREACRTSPWVLFNADLWLNLMRTVTPNAVRTRLKRKHAG